MGDVFPAPVVDDAPPSEVAFGRGPRRSGGLGQESPTGWDDLVGWIEEQGEDDTQGFVRRR